MSTRHSISSIIILLLLALIFIEKAIAETNYLSLVNTIQYEDGELIDGSISGNHLYVLAWQQGKYAILIYKIRESSAPELVNTYMGDYLGYYFAIEDGYLYISGEDNGPNGMEALNVYSLKDPINPTYITSKELSSWPSDIHIHSNYIYIPISYDVGGVDIFNISNPENPKLITNTAEYNSSWAQWVHAMDIEDKYLFATSYNEGCDDADVSQDIDASKCDYIQIIDMNIPERPNLIAEYNLNGKQVNDIEILKSSIIISSIGVYDYKNTTYLSDRKSVDVIDFSSIEDAKVTSSIDLSATPVTLKVINNKLYVLTSNNEADSALHVFDISSLHNPKKIDSITLQGESSNLLIDNSYCYIFGVNSFHIVKTSDLKSPVVKTIPTENEVSNLYISGNKLYLQGKSEQGIIYIFDISTPENPQLKNTFIDDYAGINISVSDNFLYTAGEYCIDKNCLSRLNVFELIDPFSPTLINSVPTNAWPSDLNVSGLYAYVGIPYDKGGVDIFDISLPSEPKFLVNTNEYNNQWGWVRTILYNKNNKNELYAVLRTTCEEYDTEPNVEPDACMDNILQIFDITEPEFPKIIGSLNFKGRSMNDIASTHDMVFLSYGVTYDWKAPTLPIENSGGIEVVDVSKSNNPNTLTTIKLQNVSDLFTTNPYLFAISSDSISTLHIFDISSFDNPKKMDSIDISDRTSSIWVYGNYAYVTGDKGIHIIDLASVISTSKPIVAITPTRGPADTTTFTHWGEDFTPNNTATLYFFTYPENKAIETRNIDIGPEGSFSRVLTLPDKSIGEYLWYAVDDATGIESEHVTYEITAGLVPTIGMNPQEGTLGTDFNLYGDGFTANSKAILTIKNPDGNLGEKEVDISPEGSIQYIFHPSIGGEYEWWAVDKATNVRATEMKFKVTSPIFDVTPPSNVSPANHAEITASSFMFEWAHPGDYKFELNIKDESGNTIISSGIIDSKHFTADLTSLEENESYKWSVKVYKRILWPIEYLAESTESFFTFKGVQSNITPPKLVDPETHIEIENSTYTFSWIHPFDDEYEMIIKESANDEEVFRSDKISDKSIDVVLGLLTLKPDTQYKWYVVVYANEESITSEDRFFTYDGLQVTPDYRITSLSFAPNPNPFEIPEKSTGYAWFVVEKRTSENEWSPAPGVKIEAVDEDGNPLECNMDSLPYKELTFALNRDLKTFAIFSVVIPAEEIGNGKPGDEETIKIYMVEGKELLNENQSKIKVGIEPYTYKQSWQYYISTKKGLGAGLKKIATAVGVMSGGSGTTLSLDITGHDLIPDLNTVGFKIAQKYDIALGVEGKIGSKKHIDIGKEEDSFLGLNLNGSLPYQKEYEFGENDLNDNEAMLLIYMFVEPILLSPSASISPIYSIPSLTARTFSSMYNALLINNDIEELDAKRTADEFALSINASGSLNTEQFKNVKLKLSPSIGGGGGAEAFGGVSVRLEHDKWREYRLFLGGKVKLDFVPAGLGLNFLLKNNNKKSKLFAPDLSGKLNFSMEPVGVDFECKGIDDDFDLFPESVKLKAGIDFSVSSEDISLFEFFDDRQKNDYWIKMDSLKLFDVFDKSSKTISKIKNIGTKEEEILLDNSTFSEDIVGFLNAVYDLNEAIDLEYGFDVSNKDNFEWGLDFTIPVSGIAVNLGRKWELNKSQDHNINQGYWTKGMPLLHHMVYEPPSSYIKFDDVIAFLWKKAENGNTWQIFIDLLKENIKETIIEWNPLKEFARNSLSKTFTTDTLDIPLNEKGSFITIGRNSIPESLDSLLCRHWKWEDDLGTESMNISRDKMMKIQNRNRMMRNARELAAGMKYGIGGFFRFEPNEIQFEDKTTLTIFYKDEEVTGIDEYGLSIYIEDEKGDWHYLESTVNPDINTVAAEVIKTGTYTIAPRMPKGEFQFVLSPSAIPNDGLSICSLTSDIILNNDESQVSDGSLFTIQISKGEIITHDSAPLIEGVQVEAMDGKIGIEIRGDEIALPISVLATSVEGSAYGSAEIPITDETVPSAPVLLDVYKEEDSLRVVWQEGEEPDLAGYNVWFDTDKSGPPYDGIQDSDVITNPVSVGLTDSVSIFGINADDISYYVAVTAVDISGQESDFSNEISVGTPGPGAGVFTVEAGPDQRVKEETQVLLQGSALNVDSSAVFQWIQTGGQNVKLNGASTAQASFNAPQIGDNGDTLTFKLTVTNATGATASDMCSVYVENDGPGDENNSCFIRSAIH